MPFPPGASTVTVTKDYRRADGSAPKLIKIWFRPSARSVHVGPDYTIEPVPVFEQVTDGLLSVQLFVTTGFSYEVTELVDGKQRAPFNVLIPNTGSVSLDSLAPVEPVIPQYTPVRTVEGISPDSAGNIDLPPAQGADPAGTAAGLVSAHEAASDPHPQYLTQTEGDARYATPTQLAGKENVGVAAAGDTAHTSALDPHPQYLTVAEGNAAYAALAHTHPTSDIAGLPGLLATLATKQIQREAYIVSGSINLNTGSSAWGPLPLFPTLSIPAAVGDKIGLGINAIRQTNSNMLADFGVVVGGAIRRWLGGPYTDTSPPSGTYEGDPAFYHTALPAHSAERRFVVTANDLTGGNTVVFALLCKTRGAGSALVLAEPDLPFYWQATNYGVVS